MNMMVLQVGTQIPTTGNPVIDFIISVLTIAGAFLLFAIRWTTQFSSRSLYNLARGRSGPVTNLSSAFDDVRWDGKSYDHKDNTEDWTGRALRQIHVPMLSKTERDMRNFYIDVLGMIEMRKPDNAIEQDVFWAVSGARQVRFGPHLGFGRSTNEQPSFVYSDLDAVAAKLKATDHKFHWDTQLAYVRRLLVTDPAGNAIVLIGA